MASRTAGTATEASPQRADPAQPLVPGHGGVRRRGRREDEEQGPAEPPLLRAERRPLAESAPVALLPDERERAGAPLKREPLEPRRRVGEVGLAQVAGPGSRPV